MGWKATQTGLSECLCRARLAEPYTYSAGAESLAVQFFEPHEIPFDQVGEIKQIRHDALDWTESFILLATNSKGHGKAGLDSLLPRAHIDFLGQALDFPGSGIPLGGQLLAMELLLYQGKVF